MDYVSIGGIEIEKTAVLAPMASVSDTAYRLLCRRFGAAMVYSEMISAKAIGFMDRKTFDLCRILPDERPFALQLFGSEPKTVSEAIRTCEQFAPDIFDINMGCPVPKVAGSGCGAALMKTPALAGEIIRAASAATSRPVTVKIRAGWDESSINAVEIAKIAEQNGAAAIAVHGRTRSQMYSRKADREIIRAVKNSVKIPVIANGDIGNVSDCLSMYNETGCDLVMIGRGSYGNPWLFENIRAAMLGTAQKAPNTEEILNIMLEHFRMIIELKGEQRGMHEARKHAAWYIRSSPYAAKFRTKCYALSSYSEACDLAAEYLEFLSANN